MTCDLLQMQTLKISLLTLFRSPHHPVDITGFTPDWHRHARTKDVSQKNPWQGREAAEAMTTRCMPKKEHHDAKPCLLVYRSLDSKEGRVNERNHQMTAKIGS